MEESLISDAVHYWIAEIYSSKPKNISFRPVEKDFMLFLTVRIMIAINECGSCELSVTDVPNELFLDLLKLFKLPTSVLPLYTSMTITRENIVINGEEFNRSSKKR